MIDFAELCELHGDDEYLKYDRIDPSRVLHRRPDIHAFLLLNRLAPGDNTNRDMVAGAEHDEIYLDVDVEALNAVATEQDAIDLIRCGVRYDGSTDGLAMFV